MGWQIICAFNGAPTDFGTHFLLNALHSVPSSGSGSQGLIGMAAAIAAAAAMREYTRTLDIVVNARKLAVVATVVEAPEKAVDVPRLAKNDRSTAID